MFLAAMAVLAVVGVITWLAISVRLPRLRGFFRYLLLTVAIASTTLLVASAALYLVLARGSADSPAAAVPLVLAVLCAVVAIPAWIGFVVQARCKSAAQSAVDSNAKS